MGAVYGVYMYIHLRELFRSAIAFREFVKITKNSFLQCY